MGFLCADLAQHVAAEGIGIERLAGFKEDRDEPWQHEEQQPRHAERRPNAVLPRLWGATSPVDGVPDLMRLAAAHAASNQKGALGAVGRGLAGALPDGLVRRGMDAAYRRSMRDEGYPSG